MRGKKKILIIVLLFLIIIGALFKSFYNKSQLKKEHINFKNDYEKLNGKETTNGKNYRILNISENNPFVYSTMDEILEKIENKDTFIVYFGANWCPWCRSVLEVFIDVSRKNNIKKVYYIDVRPNNDIFNEIRNVYSLDNSGNIYLQHQGTDSYNKFIDMASDILNDYSYGEVKTLKGTKYQGEKRIGAPSFVIIKKGEPVYLTSGISENQDDPYMELTSEIKKDMQNEFEDFFKEYKK